jgi:hypothetical protein
LFAALLGLPPRSCLPMTILLDARRVTIGEATEAQFAGIPGTVEKSYWVDYEKGVAAKDEFGLKQLSDAGKLVFVPDKQELLVIELDASGVVALAERMQALAKVRLSVYTSCLERQLSCVRRGLSAQACERITACQKLDYDDEYTKAYKDLQPELSPEEFWGEAAFVRVRILSGDSRGLAAWTRLKYLKLPTHARSQEPGK